MFTWRRVNRQSHVDSPLNEFRTRVIFIFARAGASRVISGGSFSSSFSFFSSSTTSSLGLTSRPDSLLFGGDRRQLDCRLTTSSLSIDVLRHSGASSTSRLLSFLVFTSDDPLFSRLPCRNARMRSHTLLITQSCIPPFALSRCNLSSYKRFGRSRQASFISSRYRLWECR